MHVAPDCDNDKMLDVIKGTENKIHVRPDFVPANQVE